MTISIVLVDDHPVFREGLRALLEQEADFSVIGEASDGESGEGVILDLKPSVAIVDISLPGMSGIELARRLSASGTPKKPPHVLALSMCKDRPFIREMFKAGAKGYLAKDCRFEELAVAIRTVAEGKPYLSQAISDSVMMDYLEILDTGRKPQGNALSAREREVLTHIAQGLSTKMIAEKLVISIKTVETYRRQIMEKLDINSVAKLTRHAIKIGLILPDQD